MAEATAHGRRLAAEASRASLLSLHAAAGLSWPHDVAAARLLRAAEGLVRSAVAVLVSSAGAASEAQKDEKKVGAPSGAGNGSSRSARRRRRRRGALGKGGLEPPTEGSLQDDRDVVMVPDKITVGELASGGALVEVGEVYGQDKMVAGCGDLAGEALVPAPGAPALSSSSSATNIRTDASRFDGMDTTLLRRLAAGLGLSSAGSRRDLIRRLASV